MSGKRHQLHCQRPDCLDAPRWDVAYKLPMRGLPYGRLVCDAHLEEMKEAVAHDVMVILDVKEL